MTRLGKWRNLNLPVKLALVTFVPLLVLITLGVVLINSQLDNAAQYSRANRITQLSASVRASISALQDERQQVATPNTAQAKGMAGLLPARAMTLPVAHREVDQSLAATRQGVADDVRAGDLDPVADTAWSSAQRLLGALPSLRADAATQKADRSTSVATYTQLVDALFAFDRVLTTDLADARLTRQALSTYDLFAARDEIRYQQAVVLAGIDMRTMSVADVTSLHGSEARLDSRISDFQAVASAAVGRDYETSVHGTTFGHQSALLNQAIDQSGGMSGQVPPGTVIDIPVTTWNAANDAITSGLNRVIGHLTTSLGSTAQTLRSDAGDSAATAVIVLLIALAATIALVVLIARQLLHSIGLLRRTARDVASRQLPDAVERIRAGETVDPTIEPVGVHTTDEVGQLARAFDAVHGEALRLAVEQANLRANYSELFVNLSRRSQSLVQRQLRLIEQLERDEEDPDQLSALFKLDHLATRMRRNNENLMVLSGAELARTTAQQVSLADLLRAGVSEIEHYQRIVVQPPPDAHIVGYAAGDLVRLLAELLDNATAFSAPDTPVTVASHRTRRKAIVIDIVDHGIGMSDEELGRANEQLSHPSGVEGRISRRMGLFVISRLADQHDVRVRLHGGQDIPGLRVTITVPAELVISEPELLPPNTQRDTDEPPNGSGPNGFGGPLPKRTAGATNRPNGPWHAALRGTMAETAAANQAQAAAAAAITVTIPKLPSAASSGVGLFAPLSTEDEAPAEPVADGGEAVSPEKPPVTPIFDTMLSAWFEEAPPAVDNGTAADTGTAAEIAEPAPGWEFAADEGWQAVDAVVDVQPAEFTAVGLPKREPKALLLPGSVRDEPGTEPEQPVAVPAERLRHRLSGFQQGLRRGRRAATPDLAPVAEPVAVTETTSADGWTSSADVGWRAADELAGVDPGEFTPAGLPRRRPKEHLLPGSVAAPAGHAEAPSRDAGVLRDRLSSFQRGVREGRGGTEPLAAAPVEHGFHW
ncbi:MAG TPA: nitrate- and nitrite sensing domain-containing protein [Pseudonocardiaceae bacterium]|nr:nitrate- and nitrite sensing domain-containing protein [Pseudonocardiaceae bacterium]